MIKVYTEYGIDFDNNRFGIGKSTEIEYEDGREIRTKECFKTENKSYYVRIWLLKTVLSIDRNGFHIKKKQRYNCKIIFGISSNLK